MQREEEVQELYEGPPPKRHKNFSEETDLNFRPACKICFLLRMAADLSEALMLLEIKLYNQRHGGISNQMEWKCGMDYDKLMGDFQTREFNLPNCEHTTYEIERIEFCLNLSNYIRSVENDE
ncbi:GSCOCG00001477001-RA-CDS [Cotesia congregata]|uniref:Uncharacterized protein n=1 Tax=Cotesia congregata TaxID=51543 RepID=A0A8J2H0L8_COTCN|nr:GSCOCG00001477001-RA-CDS [Cotesia congregata]CAG5076880.1 Protein of unknown function [Cotesia congregata]